MQRQRLSYEKERGGKGGWDWRVAVLVRSSGAPCRGRSCHTCRDRSCGRDAAPRHVRGSRPQGNGLARDVSWGSDQIKTISLSRLGVHPQNRGGVYPQPDIVRNVGLKLISKGFNQSEANHEWGLGGRGALLRARRT